MVKTVRPSFVHGAAAGPAKIIIVTIAAAMLIAVAGFSGDTAGSHLRTVPAAGGDPGRSGMDLPRPQPHSFASGDNFRLYPGPVTQTEPFIVRHPLNDSILFATANTIDLSTGFISEGIYASTDGGYTWAGSDTCAGEPIQFHRGDPGIAIDKNGVFILTHLSLFPGLYAHRSTNLGAAWTPQVTIASNDQDRADIATDGDPSSPYFGTTYASWVRFAPPFPVFISRTTDGGVTWSAPLQINNPSQRCQGADVEAGPGGILYVCWAGVGSTSPFTEDYVGFARSTDGGATWDVTENAFDINGIQGTLPEKSNIRVNGLPRLAVDTDSLSPYSGFLYIVTTEKNLPPAGSDPDIIIRSSGDSGAHWSPGIRVNQDTPNNGKIQYFPAPHVDRRGGVDILYHSDEPTTSDSAAVYFARRPGPAGGWETGEIGGHRFRPQPIGGLGAGYQGDNISLTSIADTAWPVWTDNSSGIYQLWTCPVHLSPGGNAVDEPGTLPSGYTLEQNYPNPFNPSTVIRFSLPRAEEVVLSVHDLAGRTVETLVSGRLPAGEHSAVFTPDGARTGSGMYICRLATAATRQAVKMLYIK